MVWYSDVTRQALRMENQEVEWLWSCLSAVETALAATDREMATTKAAVG